MTSTRVHVVGGPFYDDLEVGDLFDQAPAVTLTGGIAAAHHAIVGGRLPLFSNRPLSARVTGGPASLAPPALVWDIAIGQSTLITQRAIANLFYRGLAFRAFPRLGDTLRTRAEVVGLRPGAAKPGRPARGLVVMRIVTRDQTDAIVLDFHRCAILSARAAVRVSGDACGILEPSAPGADWAPLSQPFADFDLDAFRAAAPGPRFAELEPGTKFVVESGDVVTSAPELARLTFNLAAIHHDEAAAADGRRLVYGGHTIGLALAQISRALPGLVTVLGWQSCDHIGPVHEGDTLSSEISIERCEALASGGLVHIRSRVAARPARSSTTTDVLDWRLVALAP